MVRSKDSSGGHKTPLTPIADAFPPHRIAERVEDSGVMRGKLPYSSMFVLALLAGVYIGFGANLYILLSTGGGIGDAIKLPYGLARVPGAIAFSMGLIMVVVGGAELFTGNNLMLSMAVISRRLPLKRLLIGNVVVLVGNFIGSVGLAWVLYASMQHRFFGGEVGLTVLRTAQHKCTLPFWSAFWLGVLCNFLVCAAVWLCHSCRTTGDKIPVIIFPIAAFVIAGFEHSIANMFFIPIALLIKMDTVFLAETGIDLTQYAQINLYNFFVTNLIPVTLGNTVGGVLLFAGAYWYVYRR